MGVVKMEFINENYRKRELPTKRKIHKVDMRKVPKEFRPTMKLLEDSLKTTQETTDEFIVLKRHAVDLYDSHANLMVQIGAWGNTFMALLELLAEKGMDFRDMLPLLPQETQDAFKSIQKFNIENAQDIQKDCFDEFFEVDGEYVTCNLYSNGSSKNGRK